MRTYVHSGVAASLRPLSSIVLCASLSFAPMATTLAQVATGYVWSGTSGAYTAVGSAGTNALLADGWDDNQATITLPFTFYFNNTAYTQLTVSSNGFLVFGGSLSNNGPGSAYHPATKRGNYLNGSATEPGVAAFNVDLAERTFTAINGIRANGSATITGISDMTNLRVGMRLSGTGIPTNAVIVSLSGTSATLSTTASGNGSTTLTPRGNVIAYVSGSAPDRRCTVQWTRATRSALGPDDLNFQLILREGNGNLAQQTITVVYGTCTTTSAIAGGDAEVGIRTTTGDFNNRTTNSDWSSTSAGTTNADRCRYSNTIYPASGLTYTWAPDYCTGAVTAGSITGTSPVCSGTGTSLTLGGQSTAAYGLSTAWYWSTSSGGPFTNAAGSGTGIASGNLTTTRYYVATTTCSNGPTSATTSPFAAVVSAPSSTANAGADQNICVSIGTATLAGNTPVNGTGVWTQVSGTAATIVSPNSPNTLVSGMTTTGARTFRWTITNAPCASTSDNVVITALPAPSAAGAGTDQTICSASAAATMNAAAPTNGTGTWSQISGPSSATIITPSSRTTSITGMSVPGDYVFRWSVSAAPCAPSTDDVTIHSIAPASASNAGVDRTVCSNASIVLAANVPANGTGGWSVVSGPSTSASQFSNVNANNATFTPAGGAGSYTLRWTITNAPCSATQDDMVITVLPAPTGVAATSNAATVCAGGTVNLSASGTGVGTILNSTFNGTGNGWTTTNASSGGTPANAAWTARPDGYSYTGTTFHSSDASQFMLTNNDAQGFLGIASTTLVSPVFSTVGYTSAALNFEHFFRAGGIDLGYVEVSTNGSSWTTLTTFTSTQGSASAFANATVDLSAYTAQPAVQVRFRYLAFGGLWWAIDNATVTGTGTTGLTWSWTSNPVGFTSTLRNPTGVPVSQTTSFTVTATAANGCSASAGTAVTATPQANPGSNGTRSVCTSGSAFNLFTALNGSPQSGGTWTFAGSPHSATFNPAVDASGVYTYSVTGTAPCANASAAVTVTKVAPPNAGTNGTVTICSAAAPVALFGALGGIAQTGGTWTYGGAPHSATFDPATDPAGTYTYTVSGNGTCSDASATVTVTLTTATTWYADTDGDGHGDPASALASCTQPPGYVLDHTDGCPSDPNKVTPGACGCGAVDTDSDGDGTANCIDGCPNDPNKIAAGQCGCGAVDTDMDGDGTADCNDGCPDDPDKVAPGVCGCSTPDHDTDGDGIADCNDPCPNDANNADTDGDGTRDCQDGCPSDPNKIAPGACGCGTPDVDSDGDGYLDCLDACPNDPNKIAPGTCGCGVADTDSDNDGTANCTDGCPNDPDKIAPGSCGCGAPEPGSACDDGDANTTGDIIGSNCTCAGTTASNVTMVLTTDNNATSTSWEIVPLTAGPAVCSGNGYANSATVSIACDLPPGCYKLRVFDTNGDGMCCVNGQGGYVLRMNDGRRFIDALGEGIFTSTAEVAAGFCLPMGTDHLSASRCDREDYLPSDFIQAAPNAAVQAQFGIGNQTDDGYQFWFFDPNGGYSRRVLKSHANASYLFPAGADRCSYIRLNSITSDPLPHNRLLNVRVRSMVNGVFSAFGPACRLRINLTTQCPVTQLDTTAGPHYSCGRMDVPLDGSAYLWAIPVSGATKYKFRFSSGGYVRNVVSDGSGLLMNRWLTAPLLEGEVYSVRVRVSFDNGAHYCPFGPPCEVGIAQPHMVSRKASVEADGANTMVHVWPNPNRNGQVHIEVLEDDKGTHPATIEVRDLFGQAICHKELPVEGGNLGTVLDLDDRVASGLYVVSVTIGDHTHTERLILAR